MESLFAADDAQALQLQAQAREALSDFTSALVSASRRLRDLAGPLSGANTERLGGLWSRSAGSAAGLRVGDTLAGLLPQGLAQGLRQQLSGEQILRQLYGQLTRSLQQQLAVGPLQRLLGDAVGKLLGQMVTPRALGGPVQSSGLYLVGEHGPELFRAGQSGQIQPLAARGGAPAVQIVMHVTTPNVQSFAQNQSQVAAGLGDALRRAQRWR